MTAPKILITGAGGYAGRALADYFAARGAAVHAVVRRSSYKSVPGSSGITEHVCDLEDPAAVRDLADRLPALDCVVHAAAAQAHRASDSLTGDSDANLRMLEHLTASVRAKRWIHLSTVEVYGAAGRRGPVSPENAGELRPATSYGRSKLACEEFLQKQYDAQVLADVRILRLGPLYDPPGTDGVRRQSIVDRLQLPKLGGAVNIWPKPRYSLCSLDTLLATVDGQVGDDRRGYLVRNVVDPQTYTQQKLRQMFPEYAGLALPLPEPLLRPFYWLLFLIPGRRGYALRCYYWKLLRTNVFR